MWSRNLFFFVSIRTFCYYFLQESVVSFWPRCRCQTPWFRCWTHWQLSLACPRIFDVANGPCGKSKLNCVAATFVEQQQTERATTNHGTVHYRRSLLGVCPTKPTAMWCFFFFSKSPFYYYNIQFIRRFNVVEALTTSRGYVRYACCMFDRVLYPESANISFAFRKFIWGFAWRSDVIKKHKLYCSVNWEPFCLFNSVDDKCIEVFLIDSTLMP